MAFQIRDLTADVFPGDGLRLFPCTCRVSAEPDPQHQPPPPRPKPPSKPPGKPKPAPSPKPGKPRPPKNAAGLAVLRRKLREALEAEAR